MAKPMLIHSGIAAPISINQWRLLYRTNEGDCYPSSEQKNVDQIKIDA